MNPPDTPPTNPPGDDIRMAQVNAGEQAVIEKLRRQGLLPPNPPEAQTPRTDSEILSHSCLPLCELVPANFARTLERELAAMTKERDEAHMQLALIGEIAVQDWDDSTVGRVDAIVKDPQKYKDVLRNILVEIPAQLAAARAEVERHKLGFEQAKLGMLNSHRREVGLEQQACGYREQLTTLRARLTLAEQDADALAGALEQARDANDSIVRAFPLTMARTPHETGVLAVVSAVMPHIQTALAAHRARKGKA